MPFIYHLGRTMRTSPFRPYRAVIIALAGAFWFATGAAKAEPRVEFKTNQGSFVVDLDSAKAPKTVDNFLKYVQSGFYNGTIFHRVIDGFMIQGGGFDNQNGNFVEKATDPPVANESHNGLKNSRGTLAMARTNDPHSATSQFFINVVENGFRLDLSPQNPGYAVFGKVIKGMEVVDAISKVETGTQGRFRDVPKTPVMIISVRKKTP